MPYGKIKLGRRIQSRGSRGRECYFLKHAQGSPLWIRRHVNRELNKNALSKAVLFK